MAILIAETKLETNDIAWYKFYVDSKSDLESLPTSTSSGSSYSVKKYARPLSVAYCIAEARQYMLDSHDEWRPMYGLSDDVLDALDVKSSDFLNICAETKAYRDEAVSKAAASAASEVSSKRSADASASSQAKALESEKNAKASETAAKTSEVNAANSATKASDSQKAAAANETATKASADAAATSQVKAAASEKNAKASEIASKASEGSALASANSASESATKAADSILVTEENKNAASESAASAANYAKESEENKNDAKSSAVAAATSEANAKKYSDEAKKATTVDSTLSIPGAPADAKATGDALAGKADKAEVSNALSQKSDTTHTHDLSALINTLSVNSSTPEDADYYVSQYAGGGSTTITYHRRPMSALWTYIKSKADSVFAAKSHTHNYAGSGSAGGSANSAVKLDTATAGSATKPVYISGGKPVACAHSLGKDVPANAVFTDHTYSNMTAATASTAGKAGLVPAPDAGAQGHFLRGDGTWAELTVPEYAEATQTTPGLMSAADKKKLDSLYPVGSIYQSTDPTSPAALFGGTWEQIASERVLMGASSTHAAGTTVNAGLPNITGFIYNVSGWTSSDNKKEDEVASGAFKYKKGEYSSWNFEAANYSHRAHKTDFDASLSNAIYGASSTVQPAAYYVYIWHRVA